MTNPVPAAIFCGILIGAVCAFSPESGTMRVGLAALAGIAWGVIVGMVFVS